MRKFTFSFKSLLVAAGLIMGSANAWAATETLSGTDATTKDNAIAKTSFTMLATYNPSGNSTINSKNCLKVRWNRSDASTGNTSGFALKVNPGYMITKVEAQMSGNSSDLVLSDIKVDGVAYAGEYSTTLKGSGQTPAYTNITLSGIAATDYINFEYSSGGSNSQGFVYITVTYVKVNEWDFTDSGIWGSITLPTAESNTKNYQYNGVEGTSLNYVTFYSTSASVVHPSTATNGIGFSKTPSGTNDNTIYSSTSAPADNYAKIVVPAGTTISITAYTSSNRIFKVLFNGAETTFDANYAESTKDFINNTEDPQDLYMYSARYPGGTGNPAYLKKVVIKQTVPVTINYRDKDDLENTLISPSVVNVEVGSSYTPTYPSPLYVSDSDPYEYTYYSGATERTITEATSIDILYTKSDRAQYSYTLNAIKSDESVLKQIATGTAYKNANVTIPYSMYILSGGKLYSTGAIDDSNRKYSKTFVVSSDEQVETITYTENKTDVVFYAEGEDVEGITSYTASNASIRASNCLAGYNGTAGDLTVCTLTESGNYRITIATYGNKGSYTFSFKAGDKAVVTAKYEGGNGTTYSGEFIITGSTNIYWPGTDANHAIDYIYIQRIGDAEVSATISAAGFATFNSDYALDLDGIEGGKAFIVKSDAVSGENITLTTQTGKVAANTGLILKSTGGTTGTITIPVVASGTDISSTNKLVAVTENGTGVAINDYILGCDNEYKNVGLYKLDEATTLDKGQAYLPAGFNNAKALRFVLPGETPTKVVAPEVADVEEEEVLYNMAGVRVDKNFKGFVVNQKGEKRFNK